MSSSGVGVVPGAIHRFRLEPHYLSVAAGIAVLILYGSFYPFGFYAHRDPRGPLGVLLESGFQPASQDDVVANILLYLPLGAFAFYAIERRTMPAMAAATAAGFALSLLVELGQFYGMGRVQSLSDVCTNVLGTLLGALAAAAARRRIASPYLALLLVCWAGYRWYPLSSPLPIVRLGPLRVVSSISVVDLFGFFTVWLAVALILESVSGGPCSRIALPVFLVVSLLVRALAVDIDPAEIVGGAAAVLAWSGALWRLRARSGVAAVLFVALVVLNALAPFHFSATARVFGWVPFRSFLESSTGVAIRAFFYKSFLYGGMVWLLARAGFSAGWATVFGAALVFCLRLTQIYLPGRSAEITDTLLLLMFAGTMHATTRATAQANAKAVSPAP